MIPAELSNRVFVEGTERGFLEARCREILQGKIADSKTFHEFVLNLAKLVGGEERSGVVYSSNLVHITSDITLSAGMYSTYVLIKIFTLPDLRVVQGMGVQENVLSVSPDEFSPVCQRKVILRTSIIAHPYINDGRKIPENASIGDLKLTPGLVKDLCQRLFDAYQNSRRPSTPFHS